MIEIRKLPSEGEIDFINRKSYFHRFVESRLVQNNMLLNDKVDNFGNVSEDTMREIVKYWKKHLDDVSAVNFDYFKAYAASCPDPSQLKRYVPDSFFYAFVDEYLTNPMRSVPCDDKQFYEFFFGDCCELPITICRKIDGCYLDADFNPISFDDFVTLCESEPEVIVKKSMYSYGGKGILFWSKDMGKDKLVEFLSDDHQVYSRPGRVCKQFVVQRILRQHSTLAALNPSSVNTIRIMTLVHGGQVKVLSSVLRMGVDGRVDNCSSGGIVVGIDPNTSKLKDRAYDKKANLYLQHPTTGKFAGLEIPGYDACHDMACDFAMRMMSASKLISWDFAVNEAGNPVLIEMNISYGELDFHQLCNGPIFGDLTEEILKEINSRSFTYKYLFNRF